MDEGLDDSISACMARALRYLEYRARSESEMRQYLLKKGWGVDVVEAVIERLVEMEYLDDSVFAREYVASRARNRPMGRARIQSDLRAKKVDQEIIEEALQQLPPEYDQERALEAAKPVWDRNAAVAGDIRARKTISYLMRRGFSYSSAQRAIKTLGFDDESGHI